MPTVTTKTLKSSGGDYTTIAAWEAAAQTAVANNAVTADSLQQLECYNFQSADVGNTTIDGTTTDATRYFRVYVKAGEGHNGVPGTGYRFATGDHRFIISDDFFRLEGVSFDGNNVVSAPGVISIDNTGVYVIGNLVINFANTGNPRGITSNSVAITWYAYNNIVIYTSNNSDSLGGCFYIDGATCYWYNNTAVCSGGGSIPTYSASSGTAVIKNCISAGNTTNGFATGAAGSTNNASVLPADSPGVEIHDSAFICFVDPANNNYNLSYKDTGASRLGADLSADANLSFSVDVNGDTRVAPWDIGASTNPSDPTSRRYPKFTHYLQETDK